MKKLWFLLFLSVSCGQEAPAQNIATFEEFTNADWLYAHYFSNDDLPKEFRKQVMPELQMIANGFVLREAQGKDPYEAFATFDAFALQMFDDQFAERIAGQTATYDMQREGLKIEAVEKIVNAEFQKHLLTQDNFIQEFHLPYALKGYPKKIIDVEQLVLTSSKSSMHPTYWGPYDHKDLEAWKWQTGDLIMGHEPIFTTFNTSPQGFWNHVGLVTWLSNSREPFIIDAMPPGAGREGRQGVDYGDWLQFKKSYRTVGGFTVEKTSYYSQGRERVARFALDHIGTPYSLFALKGENHSNGMYCSLLAWESYFMPLHLDVDADGGLFVFPDDIAQSSNVHNFKNSFQ